MNRKPILFNTKMVQAILDGRKTTTRRLIKDVEGMNFIGFVSDSTLKEHNGCAAFGEGSFEDIVNAKIKAYKRPPYQIGDILYVRETFLKADDGFHYKADIKISSESEDLRKAYGYKWRPSIHMPKEAARILLKVTDVRIERLQNITEEQAKAEGANPRLWYQPYGTKNENNQKYVGDIIKHEANYKTGFAGIWDRTLGKANWLYSFKENPYVWVIEFERINKEEL